MDYEEYGYSVEVPATDQLEITDTDMDLAVRTIRAVSPDEIVVESSYHIPILEARSKTGELKEFIASHFTRTRHLDQVSKLIIPVNIRNSHWICVVALIKEHIICLYDSAVSRGELVALDQFDAALMVRDYIVQYGQIFQKSHFLTVPWKMSYCLFTQKQPDGWSCGYHVIQCMYLNALQPEFLLSHVDLAFPDSRQEASFNFDTMIDHILSDGGDKGELLAKWENLKDVRAYKPGTLNGSKRVVWIEEVKNPDRLTTLREKEDGDVVLPDKFGMMYGVSMRRMLWNKKYHRSMDMFEPAMKAMVKNIPNCAIALCFNDTPTMTVEAMILRAIAYTMTEDSPPVKVYLVSSQLHVNHPSDHWLQDVELQVDSPEWGRGEYMHRAVLYDGVKHTTPDKIKLYCYDNIDVMMEDWGSKGADFKLIFTDVEDPGFREQLFEITASWVDVTLMKFDHDLSRMDTFTCSLNEQTHSRLPMHVSQLDEYPRRAHVIETMKRTSYYVKSELTCVLDA
jgi:hypothetical protein